MSETEENRFDSILLALAEQHKNGVPEVICPRPAYLERISQ